MKSKILAAKIALLVSLWIAPVDTPVRAGVPVIDVSNLSQTILTAIENISQTLQQIEEYRTQLQQYETQLKNTLAPAAYIWSQAQKTMSDLKSAINTLERYKTQLGSLEKYLDKLQDADYYRDSPCFKSGGCSDEEWEAINSSRRFASEAQKEANDAAIRGLDQHQTSIIDDALHLEELQSAAEGAVGQLQAIQSASQIAAAQVNQLLQIRGLMMAQQQAIVTRFQALTNKEAQQEAASEQLRESRFKKSSDRSW